MTDEDRIVWTPEMTVGVDALDEDHQALVSYLNEFIDACDNDEGVFVTDGIFGALVHYTEDHFVREEAVMEAAGFPDLAAHKQAHLDLKEKVMECRESFMMTPSKTLEGEVRSFLLHWLQNHIMKSDKDYKELVESNPQAVSEALAKHP